MNKLLAIAIVVCGCTSQGDGSRLESERFGVCINLPQGSSYSNYKQYVDYDVASLDIGGSTVIVMIGGHPDFSQATIDRVVKSLHGFKVLGEEKLNGRDRLLLGYNRRDDPVAGFYGRENELVMFASNDLVQVRHLLEKKDFVVDCRRNFTKPE